MAEATPPLAAADRQFLEYSGPVKGVKYPVKVPYCGGEFKHWKTLLLTII